MSKVPTVSIVMGSATDVETMKAAKEVLDSFDVSNEMRVLSAHRTPEQAVAWVKECNTRGTKVIIAAAGLAAHLAGVVAANTILPVIGVPMEGGALNGIDALLSTVQMPKGTPVGTMAIGKAGAVNAGLLAIRILALSDEGLKAKALEHKDKLAAEVLEANAKLG
jgi:phosphoribosylaminoimidazole carboxylase PurE protein